MRSIRSRFTILITAAVVISVVTIGLLGIHFIRQISEEYTNDLIRLSAEENEQKLDVYLNSIEQCVDTVDYYASQEFPGASGEDPAEDKDEYDTEMHEYVDDVNTLFHSVVNSTSGIISYYFRIAPEVSETQKGFWYSRNDEGRFVASELTDIEEYDENDLSHTGWYYIPKKQGVAIWLEPYVNENLGETEMISYVSPVYQKGKFVGVLGIDYDYETFKKHLNYEGHFRKGYTFITNEDDEIIYHPEIESGTSVAEISEKLLGRNLNRNDTIVKYEYNGEAERASWGLLTNHMKLYLSVPESEINGMWKRLVLTVIGVSLAILALFILLGLLMVKRITEPLTNLTEAAIRLDEGDYSVELNYNGKDEVGVLTAAFRQLIGHLQAYISDLNDIAYKDALTHLKNKGAFENYKRKLDDRLKFSEDDDRPEFAICVFDCNSLKEVNDNYGHDKGDIYLKTACSVICDVFKHSPVFRLGGDEFVSVLQNDDYDNRLALCTKFDRMTVSISDEAEHPWERVDIASGIATYDPERDTCVSDVIKRADKRMYEDKMRKKSGIIRELTEEMVNY